MATGVGKGKILTTLSDSPAPQLGVGANNGQLSFTGTELYRFEISVGVMQNFATFEWLLWQQGSIGG